MTDTLSPAALWAQIIAMPRPHRTVDFPRLNYKGEAMGKVTIVVLTQEEQISASVETERFTRKMIRDVPRADEAKRGYDDIYNNQAAVEILHRACRAEGDTTKPFFPSPSAMREFLTPDEIGVLFRSYLIVQDEVGPIIANMSAEEMEAWIKRLQDAGSRAPLAFLSSGALIDLVYILASQMFTSATPSISPGSLPESATTSPEADAQASE